MKKFLLAILLLSIAPAMLADNCCSSNSSASCNACCPVEESCCPKSCENSCEPNGCCPEDCGDLDSCDCRVSSQSFFRVRPHFQGASPEKVSMNRLDRIYTRVEGKHGAFQIVPFGGRTAKSRRFATYFTPFCKAELLVAEDGDNNPDRDIDATAFNIFTENADFKSRICLRPRQSTAGVGLSWRQRLSCSGEEEKGFWFEVSLPITHVRNTVGLSENVLEKGGGIIAESTDTNLNKIAQPNMTTAFQQAAFKFGRIPCNCGDGLTKTGVADVDLRVGYGWKSESMCHLESYLGVLIPAGNKVRGCNIFEPIVGHDHHVGFEFGNAGGFRVWANEEKEREVWVETAIHSIYLNKNTQRRSFDVKYKPWSRYLPVYCNFAQAQQANTDQNPALYTQGINVFTQDVEVHGRFQRTYNTAFVYNSCRFSGEAGYNFFCRDAECVELCNWCDTVAFVSCGSQSGSDVIGVANRFRTITHCNNDCLGSDSSFSEDQYNENTIKQADLDLNSAAAPCQTQHTFYANLGYRWDDIEYPTFVGVGGSYEFAPDNTGLNRWLVWGKVGMSY